MIFICACCSNGLPLHPHYLFIVYGDEGWSCELNRLTTLHKVFLVVTTKVLPPFRSASMGRGYVVYGRSALLLATTCGCLMESTS